MPRSLLPPEGYARISIHVLFDLGLPPVVRDTYTSLRVLAWSGDETPELSWEQIAKYTGKERATVYRHMLMLVNKGVIHWRTASVGTIVLTFTDGLSQNREMPIKSLIPKNQEVDTPKDTACLKNETTTAAGMREIQAEYEKLLGYRVNDWAAGEGKAAKQIGARYTVSQFREAYEYLKAQEFWRSKRLRLRYVVGEIDEYFASKAAGRLNGGRPAASGNGRLPDGV